jgi:hypothetical protein
LGPDTLGVASFSGIQAYSGLTTGQTAGPTTIFSTPGAYTGLVKAGNYYIAGNSGTGAGDQAIIFLQPGATPTSPLTNAGSLQFAFPSTWEHSQMGVAARPAPGQPGSYDVIFNVGSEYDHQTSTDTVGVSGLTSATLQGDSLYELTVDLTGDQPVVTGLKQVVTGIRNVIGMAFQPGTGDFYFADNAIDGTGPTGDEPPQAEEINLIAAADLGAGPPINFGYPSCYIQYRTGAEVGSGCVQPLFAIQPLPNGTALGSESEGVTQIAFAPTNFPAGYNNGIFLGFDGKGGVTGPENEENAVGYYDFPTGKYIHFSENSQNGVYEPIGILTTADQLIISDFGAGIVYNVTAAGTPPPPVLSTDSVSPQDGSGGSQIFTFAFSDSNGYEDLIQRGPHVLIHTSPSGTGSCWVLVEADGVRLAPDNPNSYWVPVAYGSGTVASNSQCTIDGAGTTLSGAGTGLTLHLAVTFRTAYAGTKNIYTDVNSTGGNYVAVGTYGVTATAPDFTLSVSPASQNVQIGHSATYTVTANALNGFNQNITLSFDDSARGLSGTFSPAVITGGSGSSTLTVTVPPDAPESSGTVGITGTTASVSSAATAQLNVTATPPPPAVSTDSVSPQNASGSGQVFTFTFSDTNGFGDLLNGRYHVLINAEANGMTSCWVLLQSGGVSLAPDDPDEAWSFVPYGSSGTAQNSQCGVNGTGTTVSGSGNQLTLNLSLMFTTGYVGKKSVFTDVNGNGYYEAVTGYTVTGTPPTVSTDSVSPENGGGSGETFTFVFSDSDGYTDLLSGRYHVLIHSAVDGTSSCWVLLQSRGVRLAPDDPNQGWTFVPYGSSTSAQNSQCAVKGAGTSISGSGNRLTLSLSLTFTAAYRGMKNVYTDANASAPFYRAASSYTVQ